MHQSILKCHGSQKVIAVVAVAYAFSPIDLIPDFIPILGLLDEAIILPMLIWLAVRFTPQQVILDAEQQAEEWLDQQERRPQNYLVAVLIILVWITLALMAYFYFGGGL